MRIEMMTAMTTAMMTASPAKTMWWWRRMAAVMVAAVLAMSPAEAPGGAAEEALEGAVDALRSGRPATVSTSTLKQVDPAQMLDALAPLRMDVSETTRFHANRLAWSLAKARVDADGADEIAARRRVAEWLATSAVDASPLVSQQAVNWLLDFEEADFSSAAKDALDRASVKIGSYPKLLRVIGIANPPGAMATLDAWIASDAARGADGRSGMWYGSSAWHARLAKARLGSADDARNVAEQVEAEVEVVTRVSRLLDDLAYTRRPEAIEVIGRYLRSDGRLPSACGKGDAAGVLYAEHAVHALTEAAPEMPVPRKFIGGYAQSDIHLARTWLDGQENR
jgi:hypothetical protein